MDGDLIYLYPAEYNLEILGAVNSSGRYDLLAGDRISDLIELAQGLSESARKDSASLVRLDYETGETSASIFSPEKVITDTESSDNLFLQSGDRIYIRELAEYDSKYSVTVAGEAVYPGDFAIEPGKTTLYEILKACGGATELGSLKKAWLQRTSAIDSTDTSDPEYLRLMERSLLELTNMEREYLKFKSRQMEGKIAVDFSKLQQREATGSRIFLQDGDQIYIPVKSETVSIIGAVMHPGAYNWEPGQSFDHYIKLAGGYTNRARKQKVRIINDESGAWQKRDKLLVVNAGDQIFVPEKEEEDFWQLTKETLSILAQLATVVIAVVNIYNN
jgi:protein involved in polysaccharide export with SLBB domain